MTFGPTLSRSVLLSGFVLPQFYRVGQPKAAQRGACPTVQPFYTLSRTHERSEHAFAPVARMRVFSFLSIHEKKVNKVGQ